jgi:bis(5'-nucleosyl)-tetraphosphatase (symmetrical)
MATYAIGDIQGCHFAFQALLRCLNFNVAHDQLWLVGDIINRGSGSLEVLRWCYRHQDCVHMVLGNHDLHGLAVAHGQRKAHRGDTLQTIIDAPDADDLLTWLRHRPLIISNEQYLMVHAGLLPQWNVGAAMSCAAEVQAALQAPDYVSFLRDMYGSEPAYWRDDLSGMARLRLITNAMTRMRVCTPQGTLEFDFKGELNDIPDGYVPWFDVLGRQTSHVNIICGHWSALGLYHRERVFALDTGCLWGGQLTAMCLETGAFTQVLADPRDLPSN